LLESLEDIATKLGVPIKACEQIFGKIREWFEDVPCSKLGPAPSKVKAKAKCVAVPQTPLSVLSAPSTPMTVMEVSEIATPCQDTEGYRSASQTDNISWRERESQNDTIV
jgi:hypothetical protein